MSDNQQYWDSMIEGDETLIVYTAFGRSEHSFYMKAKYKFPAPFSSREYVSIGVWEKLGDGNFFAGFVMVQHPHVPVSPGFVRMTGTRCVTIRAA
jgi:hypothetical protein